MKSRRWWFVVGVAAWLLAACSSGSGTSRGSSGAVSTTRVRDQATSTTVPAANATSTTAVAATGGARWTTYDGDAARSGVAADGPASANATRMQWASAALDGEVYAQPLLVGDRVVIATENDSVYLLDSSDGTEVWKAHVGEAVSGSSLPCGNVDPVGITGTPVVDAKGGRIYVVGMVAPGRHMLFELDLSTGHVLASVRVDAAGADPLVHNQRGALTLAGGQVFVPYGGRYGDCGDYHGQVVAVSVAGAELGPVASYTLPTQGEGGFWAPPGAVVASDGTLFLTSGNSSSSGAYDDGNSVVHLSADLKLLDTFAPSNWAALNARDADLGSTSPVLLPGNRVFQIGKTGTGYLLDEGSLGGIGGQLHAASVCDSSAFGGVAHDGNTLYVPCSDGIVEVSVTSDTFSVGWNSPMSTPGPTIVAGDAVWTVATGSGDLVAVDRSSGATLSSQHIGAAPSRFTSPAAGSGRVVVGAGRRVIAFGS